MSGLAFTPGPWEAADVGGYSDYGGNSRVILGDDIRVAVVLRGGNDEAKAEGDANARLIAAAPELYADNELAASGMEETATAIENVFPLYAAGLRETAKRLRTTAAKARGEQ